MPQFFSRLVVDHNQDEYLLETSFWHDTDIAAFNCNHADKGQTLNALAFKVRRNPKNLLSHLRRIYFCYQECLPAQLYAALLDLLIVLQGKGQAISHRMIRGSRSRLDQQQFLALDIAGHQDYERLGNNYSLFTTGRLSKRELVEHKHQAQTEHDFLLLANDFIEFSQLEQAMDTLETGINVSPDRQDLQDTLLELYQSTGNHERFQTFHKTLIATGVPLIEKWQSVEKFFEGQSK